MIELTANFGPMVEGLAAADALMALDKNVPYWDAIIDYAFNHANNEFNTAAAAMGESGSIKHMFEWGTIGVNRQATNMRARPGEERARLWKNFIIDRGPKSGVWLAFEYKPSIANVPISTSVPQEIRSLMRRHVFEWKARVMEEGRPVHIERRDAQFLLIPYSPSMTGFRAYDKKRGYMLTRGSVDAIPGRQVQGNFTAFWTQYWTGRGPEQMAAIVEKEITEDFLPYMAETKAARPVRNNIIAAVNARSKAMQMEVAAKAKARVRHGI